VDSHHVLAASGGLINGAAIGAFFFGHLPEWAAALAILASLAQLIRFGIDAYRWLHRVNW
jgi:hypothetical protein